MFVAEGKLWLANLAIVAVVLGPSVGQAAEIGTGFTYQGFLEKPAGTAVTDTCDFEFALCNDPVAACDPAAVSSHAGIEVTDGVFTVPDVDFGNGACNGEARWMEISVMCGSDLGFETLAPRAELKPAPYALRAVEGVGPPAGIHVAENGNVGVGTATPATKLHVAVSGYNGVFVEGDDTGDARFSMENGGGPHFIFDDDSDDHSFKIESAFGRALAFNTSGPNERMRIDPEGNVGIGTNAPQAQLDVSGAARATTLELIGGSELTSNLVGWGINDCHQASPPSGNFVAIAVGGAHSLALRNDGSLVAWGYNNYSQSENTPSGTFTAIAAGWEHNIAIRSDGTLVGWGNSEGGLTNVPSGTFTAIAAGNGHNIAIRTDGTLVGWGFNLQGQVPTGSFVAVSAGLGHSLAIREDGTLVGWGNNDYGQSSVPDGTFIAVAGGDRHSLGIRTDGMLAGWGQNGDGQISVPPGTFVAIAAARTFSLGIRADGTLVGWGSGLEQSELSPIPDGTFAVVSTKSDHCLAIRSGSPATTEPALRLLVDSATKPGSNTWTIFSDRRLKSNITPLSGALDHLLQLRGVNFHWRDPATQGGIRGVQMGLIADEVHRVFPQWVGRDARGYQTLTVGGFEALTAEAMRELREEKDCQIAELQAREADKDQRINELEARLAAIEALMNPSTNAEKGGAR